jgi:hypothetical protein
MDDMQFLSKCCRARVIEDYSDMNDENQSYTQPRWKCVKCNKIITEITLGKRAKRLR